jgi:hypothetical protein
MLYEYIWNTIKIHCKYIQKKFKYIEKTLMSFIIEMLSYSLIYIKVPSKQIAILSKSLKRL